MFARDLSKYRVRQVLINSFDLTEAMTEFVDYRPLKCDIVGIQKMVNRRRNKYRNLHNKTAKIQAIVKDWNNTKPPVPVNDGMLRNYVFQYPYRLTLPT
jgi:hypothetical protein